MFEKEAKEYLKKDGTKAEQILDILNEIYPLKITLKQVPFILAMIQQVFKDGAEFGYNKCKEELNHKGLTLQSDMDKTIKQNIALKKELSKVKEWHCVKYGDYPKKKGVYLVAWKRTHYVEEYGEWGFDVDLFNADEGYFEGDGDFVIAWKEITLPKKEY